MLCISAVYAGMQCPSVTFVRCAKRNKDILEIFIPFGTIFSPCGSQAILVFLYQTVALFQRDPLLGRLPKVDLII